MNLNLHCFPTPDLLDQALAACIAGRLREGLAARRSATLVVSGGRTPAGFFRALSHQALDWSLVTVTLADERCVAEDSPHSNAASVRSHLLQGAAGAARFVPLFLPDESVVAATARLAALPAEFDAVVLGMGEDGHTASIFPHNPQREAALSAASTPLLAVQGGAPVAARLTLSAARLLATRSLFLHITGEAKWRVFGQAAATPDPALPISHFLHARDVEKHVFWTR